MGSKSGIAQGSGGSGFCEFWLDFRRFLGGSGSGSGRTWSISLECLGFGMGGDVQGVESLDGRLFISLFTGGIAEVNTQLGLALPSQERPDSAWDRVSRFPSPRHIIEVAETH